MKSQLLFAFLAVAVVGAQAFEDVQPHVAIFNQLVKTETDFRTFIDTLPIEIPGLNAACQAAGNNLVFVLRDCGGALFGGMGGDGAPGGTGGFEPPTSDSDSGDDGPFPNFNATLLNVFCADSCVDRLKNSVRALAIACSADVPLGGFEQYLDMMTAYLRVYCLKDANGNFCIPTVMQSLAIIGFNDDSNSGQHGHGPRPLNASQLDRVCTPCLALIAKAYAELGNATAVFDDSSSGVVIPGGGGGVIPGGGGDGVPSSSSSSSDPGLLGMFSLLCIKDGTRYCYPKFVNFTMAMQARKLANITGPLPSEYICDRCIQRVIGKLGDMSDDEEDTEGTLLFANNYCALDGQGRVCAIVIQSSFSAVEQACPDIEHGVCSPACKDAITAFIAAGGCCAGNMLRQLAHDMGVPVETAALGLKQACGFPAAFSFPDPCPTRSAVFRAVLRNLKYSYYIANKALVDAKVKQDVAANAGVDPSTVTITGASALSTGVKYALMSSSMTLFDSGTAITTQITSTGSADTIVGDLNAAIAAGTFTYSSVATLPSEASFDPTAGAGDTPSPQFAPPTSTASAAQPSLILALLLLALTLF